MALLSSARHTCLCQTVSPPKTVSLAPYLLSLAPTGHHTVMLSEKNYQTPTVCSVGPEAIRAPERQCFQLDTAHCSMHPSTAPQHTHCLLTTIYVPLCPSLLCPMPYLLLPCDFTPEPGPTQAPLPSGILVGMSPVLTLFPSSHTGLAPSPATLGHLQNTFEVGLAPCSGLSITTYKMEHQPPSGGN